MLVEVEHFSAAYLAEVPLTHPVGFALTRKFLETALAEGAQQKQPKNTSEKVWIRQRNMIGTYYGSVATLEDMGNIHGLGRQAIQQIIANGMRNLWENCSEETQRLFPIDTLPLRKPLSQKSRERFSAAQGGTSLRVRALLSAGNTAKEVQRALGLSSLQLSTVRRTLRHWGTELPYIREGVSKNPKLETALRDKNQEDEEVQRLLGQVTIGFYRRHIKGNNPLLVSVRKVAADFHFSSREEHFFIDPLRRAIPVGEVVQEVKSGAQQGLHRYYFLLARHQERARAAFLREEGLQRFLQNPVKLVCGAPNTKLPTTTALAHSTRFCSPVHIFAEFGVRYSGPLGKMPLPDFLGDKCPVPVFCHRRQYFYPSAQADNLRAYIAKRLAEL